MQITSYRYQWVVRELNFSERKDTNTCRRVVLVKEIIYISFKSLFISSLEIDTCMEIENAVF